jgi:hypothetical protein
VVLTPKYSLGPYKGAYAILDLRGGPLVTGEEPLSLWKGYAAEMVTGRLRVASEDWKAPEVKSAAATPAMTRFKPGDKVRVKNSTPAVRYRGDTGKIDTYVPFGKYYVDLKKNGQVLVDEADLEKV